MKSKISKTIISFATAAMLIVASSLPCFAESGFECEIKYNSDDVSLNMTGSSAETVTVYVYDSNTTPSEFSNINIPRALYQHNIKRYTSFDFDVNLGDDLPNGEYIAVASDGTTKVTYTFKHLNSESAAKAVKAINSAAKESSDAVKAALDENASLLMISGDDLALYRDITADIIYGRGLQFDIYTELFDVIGECRVIKEIISADKSEVINLAVQNSEALGIDLDTYYNPLSDEAKEYIADKISDDDTYKTESFATGFARLSALAKIKFASRWQDIRDAITNTHKDVIGIDVSDVADVDSVFRDMMNGTYSDFDDIEYNFEMYKDYTPSYQGGGGGSSGGGGFSSGGGVPVIGNTSGQNESVNQNEQHKTNVTVEFDDISSAHWAKSAVDLLVAKGVLSGYPDNTFRPLNHITRAEFVKMIVTAFDIDGNAQISFSDVTPDAWYAPFVAKAYSKGIISGVSQTEFAPESNITRQDAALIIYRIVKNCIADGEAADFSDGHKIAGYAKDAVYALARAGILNGMGDGSFAPDSSIDRQSAAVLISKCIE